MIETSFREYLERTNMTKGSIRTYLDRYHYFLRWLEATGGSVEKLTRTDVVDFRGELVRRHLKANTINSYLGMLRHLVYFLGVNDLGTSSIKDLIIRGIKEHDDAEPKALTVEEVRKLRRALDEFNNVKYRAMVEMMLSCGLRASEVGELTKRDVRISERKGSVTIIGKGEVQREVPIPKRTREALEPVLGSLSHKDEYLFTGRTGRPLTRKGVYGIVKRLGAFCGLPDLSPHTLRHTYGTILVQENGVDLPTVRRLMGHSSVITTTRYAKPTRQRMNDVVEDL